MKRLFKFDATLLVWAADEDAAIDIAEQADHSSYPAYIHTDTPTEIFDEAELDTDNLRKLHAVEAIYPDNIIFTSKTAMGMLANREKEKPADSDLAKKVKRLEKRIKELETRFL